MATFTTRLLATKPASSENVSITTLNANADLFDAAVGSSVGTSAARPASAFSGRLWYSTDVTKLYVNTAVSASVAASWADPVANALLGNVVVGGSESASGGITSYRSSAGSMAYAARVNADSQDRFQVTAGGSASWGSGAATQDTNLYRSAADTLKTDDNLIVGSGLTSVGAMSASTTLAVGGVLSANGGLTVVGKGQKTYVRKSATESVISNTTLQSDDHITFTLAASATYELSLYLAVSGPSAGDFKTAWVFTGAASGGSHSARYALGPGTSTSGVTDTTMRSSRPSLTTATSYGVDGSNVSSIMEKAILDTTPGSGTITLQWAQNSSTATSTVVSTDTWAVLERLV